MDTKGILEKAMKNGYGIGGFNVNNMESLQAVIDAHQKIGVPVIVQTTESALKYSDGYLVAMIKHARDDNNISMHLDHGKSLEIVKKCIGYGYDSVMMDASDKSFEKNMEITKKVVDLCKANNTDVEGELGVLGSKKYTDPDKVEEFVRKTGVDFLAIAIGNKHGLYQGEPDLDFSILKKVSKAVDIPLVLHGSSGLSDPDIQKTVEYGITKLNTDTCLRIAFTEGVKKVLNKDMIDPRTYLGEGRKRMMNKVVEKIQLYKGE